MHSPKRKESILKIKMLNCDILGKKQARMEAKNSEGLN